MTIFSYDYELEEELNNDMLNDDWVERMIKSAKNLGYSLDRSVFVEQKKAYLNYLKRIDDFKKSIQ